MGLLNIALALFAAIVLFLVIRRLISMAFNLACAIIKLLFSIMTFPFRFLITKLVPRKYIA